MKKNNLFTKKSCTLEETNKVTMKYFFIMLFCMISFLMQGQTIKFDDVTLSRVDKDLVLVVDKVYNKTNDFNRHILITRNNKKDGVSDITEIELGANYFDLTWDGISGFYTIIITTEENCNVKVKTKTLFL